MVMHELLNNAVQYGAPKQSNGHLTNRLHQETLGESGSPRLHLDWKESGVQHAVITVEMTTGQDGFRRLAHVWVADYQKTGRGECG